MKHKLEDVINREKQQNNPLLKDNTTLNKSDTGFYIFNPESNDIRLLGYYNSKDDLIKIFLGNICALEYKKIKKENKDLFEFLESDANKISGALQREEFDRDIDNKLFENTADAINETFLHELTHKFSNTVHPQNYKSGRQYFINAYISQLYTDIDFTSLENDAKQYLKSVHNINSYKTNDFNNLLRKVIKYCGRND